MKWFSNRVFLYTFPIAVGLALTIALAVIVDVRTASDIDISVATILALLSAVVFAGLTASYRYPIRVSVWAYRRVMRGIAKRAVRSSLSQAMTRIPCLGIINRNGTVALRIRIEGSYEVGIGFTLNVYDSVNDEWWGRVAVVEVGDTTSLCVPFDRINVDFWEHLETRMRYDTLPPGIYLVPEMSAELMDVVERLLDGWR